MLITFLFTSSRTCRITVDGQTHEQQLAPFAQRYDNTEVLEYMHSFSKQLWTASLDLEPSMFDVEIYVHQWVLDKSKQQRSYIAKNYRNAYRKEAKRWKSVAIKRHPQGVDPSRCLVCFDDLLFREDTAEVQGGLVCADCYHCHPDQYTELADKGQAMLDAADRLEAEPSRFTNDPNDPATWFDYCDYEQYCREHSLVPKGTTPGLTPCIYCGRKHKQLDTYGKCAIRNEPAKV